LRQPSGSGVEVIAGGDVAVGEGVMVNVGDDVIVTDTDGGLVVKSSICPAPRQPAKSITDMIWSSERDWDLRISR
jgi:hypothetical protein